MYPIYCINLEHRKDRKEHTIKEFEKIGETNIHGYKYINKYNKYELYYCNRRYLSIKTIIIFYKIK
jgi:hypothetical protein